MYSMLYKKYTKKYLTRLRDSGKTSYKSKLSKALSLVPFQKTVNFQLPNNYPLQVHCSLYLFRDTGNNSLSTFWLLMDLKGTHYVQSS